MNRLCALLFPVFILSLISSVHLAAQQTDDLVRFRLAQSFEQSGDWEKAAEIYQSLLRGEPQNYVYFDRLRTAYLQLKEYGKAIGIVKERLQWSPKDPALLASLGGLTYRSGNEARADSIWGLVVKEQSRNVQLYRLLAAEMMNLRLYERCIRLYNNARAEVRDPNIFTEELASLYVALQQYSSAVREFVRVIRLNPAAAANIRYRIQLFSQKPEALKEAIDVVKAEVAQQQQAPDVQILFLLGWLYIEAREYEQAYAVYQRIDDAAGAQGRELYNFGTQMFQRGEYLLSIRALEGLLKKAPASIFAKQAEFMRARAAEELARNAASAENMPQTDTSFTAQSAVRMYGEIIRADSLSPLAAQSWYRIGLLKRDLLFDLHGSAVALRNAERLPSAGTTRFDAGLARAEALLLNNDLSGARGEYERLSAKTPADVQRTAKFRLAELDYFDGKFDDALAKLAPFEDTLNLTLSNDALRFQAFISENKRNAGILTAFARIELLQRQRKLTEADASMNAELPAFAASGLYDDALMLAGEIASALKRPQEAIAYYRMVTDTIPHSIHKDKAQLKIADAYRALAEDSVKAFAAYEELLVKYPDSIYAEEARRRMRELRGERVQ